MLPKLPPWLFYSLISVIAAVWATCVLVSIFTKFVVPEAVNGVFTIVVGALFVGQSRNDEDDNRSRKDEDDHD